MPLSPPATAGVARLAPALVLLAFALAAAIAVAALLAMIATGDVEGPNIAMDMGVGIGTCGGGDGAGFVL